MTTRIIINGANGKMGQLAVKTFTDHEAFTIVAETGKQHNLAAEIKKHAAQIVIDLTNADAVFKNTETIINNNAHPIIGTTGLLPNQIQELQKICSQKKLGGIIAPNFSLGAVLMMKYAKEIAKYFSEVEIIEMHHAGKLDSPSGTAIHTANLIAQNRTKIPTDKSSREIIPHARGAVQSKIQIHSVRLPGVIADQQVIFGGSGETLTLMHKTIDRQCFMPGIVLACEKVLALKELVVGLENVL